MVGARPMMWRHDMVSGTIVGKPQRMNLFYGLFLQAQKFATPILIKELGSRKILVMFDFILSLETGNYNQAIIRLELHMSVCSYRERNKGVN